MTDAELDELLSDCPTLFHMAEKESWPPIRDTGLWSTSALLDRFEKSSEERIAVEARRRPRGVTLEHPLHGRAVIRDNKPMNDRSLERCLEDGLRPEDWYRILNARVFFWLSRKRLLTLLAARSYAETEHDVLEIEARPLVEAYRRQITLSPINSGATSRFPVKRGLTTFLPLSDYPYAEWRRKRARGERAVELAVSGGVSDIARFTRRVVRMKGDRVVGTLFQSP
ncbi:MAG: hypothetical protein INR68_07525 [Methylobacterium mesophilicum]|nr:hypothetical protein [Methylobacterium mesophilicum]